MKRTTIASLILAALLGAACFDKLTITNDNDNNNDNTHEVSPQPSPSPSASPSSKGAVDSLDISQFGAICTSGSIQPGDPAIVPATCSSFVVTATPKSDGVETSNHGSNLTLTATVTPPGAATVTAFDTNTVFNRNVKRNGPGSVTFVGVIREPQGEFSAVKTFILE